MRFKDRGLLFSRYAVPIALAWKSLQKGVYSSNKTNLLPDYIVDRQKLPKLAAHGYLLLFLLALTATSFSFLISQKKVEIRQIQTRIASIKQQISNNKSLTDRVTSFDSKIIDIEKKIALADTFSKGYDLPVEFLTLLNKSIRETGDIWITDLKISGTKISFSGLARRRNKIPQLATKLGGANVKKITRALYRNTNVFSFNMDRDIKHLKKSIHIEQFMHKPAQNVKIASSAQNPFSSAITRKGIKLTSETHADTKGQTANTVRVSIYKLLIGQFDSRKKAAAAADKFRSKGYSVDIMGRASKSDKGMVYDVYVGAYKSREIAQKLSDKLAVKSGIHNKVVKIYN